MQGRLNKNQAAVLASVSTCPWRSVKRRSAAQFNYTEGTRIHMVNQASSFGTPMAFSALRKWTEINCANSSTDSESVTADYFLLMLDLHKHPQPPLIFFWFQLVRRPVFNYKGTFHNELARLRRMIKLPCWLWLWVIFLVFRNQI